MITQSPQLVFNFKFKNQQVIHGLDLTLEVLLTHQLMLVHSLVLLEQHNNSLLTLTALIIRLQFKLILAIKVNQHSLLAP